MGKMIYMDHAATTAVRPEVLEAMLPYFTEKYGNPSGVYTFASRNKDVVNVSRDIIADSLGAKPEEIFLRAVVRSLTTGHSRQLLKLMRKMGSI